MPSKKQESPAVKTYLDQKLKRVYPQVLMKDTRLGAEFLDYVREEHPEQMNAYYDLLNNPVRSFNSNIKKNKY